MASAVKHFVGVDPEPRTAFEAALVNVESWLKRHHLPLNRAGNVSSQLVFNKGQWTAIIVLLYDGSST